MDRRTCSLCGLAEAAARSVLRDWRAGRSGWTVARASLRELSGAEFIWQRELGRVAFRDPAARRFLFAAARYWFAFSDIYPSKDEAAAATGSARAAGFGESYPRFVGS